MRVFTERGADDERELIRRIGAAQIAINIRAHARFSDTVFTACPALKLVSVWGTGTDNIDLNAAGMRGVTVCNTPGINAFAVAEHALTLMLAVGRRITLLDAEMRAGRWPRELLTQLLGKTLGVLGMGTIGARVAALGRASAWTCSAGARWATTRASARPARGPPPKEDILTHRRRDQPARAPRRRRPAGFIGRKEFALMKPTAILVNTGRGALVERDALLAALTERRIMGAGLDVFHQEPLAPDDPIAHAAQRDLLASQRRTDARGHPRRPARRGRERRALPRGQARQPGRRPIR